jgi:hypothetical protein
VIETAFHALCLDSGSLQQVKDFMRDLLTADIGVLFLVIVVGETIEAAISRLANVPRELEDLRYRNILVDQIRHLSRVDVDSIPSTLPMRRKDNHRTGLDLGSDLAPDLSELAVCRVLDIIHDNRLAEISHRSWNVQGRHTPPWLRKYTGVFMLVLEASSPEETFAFAEAAATDAERGAAERAARVEDPKRRRKLDTVAVSRAKRAISAAIRRVSREKRSSLRLLMISLLEPGGLFC